MLQGEAKTNYMRDYMRRNRAGQPTTTPKQPKPKAESKREKEKRGAAEEAAKPKVRYCRFCWEPTSTERIFAGNDFVLICEVCVAECAAVIAEAKASEPVSEERQQSDQPAPLCITGLQG